MVQAGGSSRVAVWWLMAGISFVDVHEMALRFFMKWQLRASLCRLSLFLSSHYSSLPRHLALAVLMLVQMQMQVLERLAVRRP